MKLKLFIFALFAIISFVAYQKYSEYSTPKITQSPNPCIIGGCSGQICISADNPNSITTCEVRAEYGCYKNTMCETQSNGKCGWTQTKELKQCLARYSQ